MLEIEPSFAERLPAAGGRFDWFMQREGELFRDLDNRRTLRFQLGDRRYFLKAHFGVGWKEILKNLLQLRMPVLGARNEWRAIRRLQSLGVETMQLSAFGEQGLNPASRQSFVVTEALENTVSLEDYCAPWEGRRLSRAEILLKRRLIERVATVARTLHDNGVNHRDFYICHFLLGDPSDAPALAASDLHLYLIDLHRVQIRRRTPLRWRVKDIGGLYFSAMKIGLTRRDLFRFMKAYRAMPLRDTLARDRRTWARCRERAHRLYQTVYNEPPVDG